jgi:tetratricopeptide (TPR) repeat protein
MKMNQANLYKEAKDLFDKNQLNAAKILFEKIVLNEANHLDANFWLGNIYYLKGEMAKAIKAFKLILQIDPHHTEAAVSLSVILNDIGRYEEASKVYASANQNVGTNKDFPDDPHLNKKFSLKHYELAELYYRHNRYDEALFEYNKARDLDLSNLELRIKIAKVYSKKGFFAKAQEELTRLKSEHPEFIPARIAMGLLFYSQGQIVEAQSEWRFALSKEPQNEQIKTYLKISDNATETRI